MIQNSNNEDTRCLLAESVKILSVSLLEKLNCLIFNNCNHVILTILTQEEAKRSSRKQDIG